MTKTPDPIQELVTAARRKQILDAATQVFAEKGFHRATIKDIARVARIADGTIYTYFTRKDEILLAVLDRLNETTERKQQFVLSGEQTSKHFFTPIFGNEWPYSGRMPRSSGLCSQNC